MHVPSKGTPTNLVEFKVSKAIFDDVKDDPEFRMGFEAEFHLRNASALLADETGKLPDDFSDYSVSAQQVRHMIDTGSESVPGSSYYEHATVFRLARLLESQLGLGENSISTEQGDYTRWTLMTDVSLYRDRTADDPINDLGLELISPVMTLRDGLQSMVRVFDLISSFRQGNASIYTSDLCGLHVNLSHTNMAQFDYAKLAVLGGDQKYLDDFSRLGTRYAKPLMQSVYNDLYVAKRTPSLGLPAASRLLSLRGWNAQRVMDDMNALIPMDHHMSIDFRRLTSNNPYIEIRIAGNRDYEQRFDDIARMAIRYAALIKVACDPSAQREEYLKKVYQLVSGITSAQPRAEPEDPFPKIHVFLSPIMSTVTRNALNLMHRYYSAQTLTVPNGSILFLKIVRSAIDMRVANTTRIRQGLLLLLEQVLHIRPLDLLKSLKTPTELTRNGIIRQGDNDTQMIAMLTNYIKTLNQQPALVR